MRKISEIVNEDALDLLADILDPVMVLGADKELEALFKKKETVAAVRLALKKHKAEIMTILAALDGEDVKTYRINIVQIPTRLFQLLNDEDMATFFESQGLKISGLFSGSATENTEVTETK